MNDKPRPGRPGPIETLIGDQPWDYILVGDGSGQGWDGPAGWGTVVYDREAQTRVDWQGTTKFGTNNFAELMAYVPVLDWICCVEMERRRKGPVEAIHVHVVTDSQWVATTGAAGPRRVSPKHGPLWAAFDAAARAGILVHWHWKRRGTTPENCDADKLSKQARKLGEAYNT